MKNLKTIIILFACISIVCVISPPAEALELAINQITTLGNPITIPPSTTKIFGEITEAGQVNNYIYTAPVTGRYRIWLADRIADRHVILRLYDSLSNNILDANNAGTVDLKSGEKYTIQVAYYSPGYGGGLTSYTLMLGVPNEIVEFPSPMPKDIISRIYGSNRYSTAVAISMQGWDSSDNVILARGDGYADALAGAPLAYALDAPILLTPKNKLADSTKNEIKRLRVKEVTILGGFNAVSEEVELALEEMSLSVRRISGLNRYETASNIALELAKHVRINTAVVVYSHNFPDALSVSSYAAANKYPILLANNALSVETKEAIATIGIKNFIIVDGTNSLTQEFKNTISPAQKIEATSHYENAIKLAEFFNASKVCAYLTTGTNYADAIAGGVLAAKTNSGIFFVAPEGLTKEVKDHIVGANYKKIAILGGSTAVNDAVGNSIVLLKRQLSGEIAYRDQINRYDFTAPVTGRYRIMLLDRIEDRAVQLRVYDSLSRNILDRNNSGTIDLNKGETYRIEVSYYSPSYGGGLTSYTMRIGIPNEIQSIAPSIRELNGEISFVDQINQYTYTAPVTGRYRIMLLDRIGDRTLQLRVYDSLSRSILDRNNSGTIDLNKGETYRIEVAYYSPSYGGGLTTYRLRLGVPNEVYEIPINAKEVIGRITYIDQINQYTYKAPTTGTYTFTTVDKTENRYVKLRVYDSLSRELKDTTNYCTVDLKMGEIYRIEIAYYNSSYGGGLTDYRIIISTPK